MSRVDHIFREYIGVKPYPTSLNNFPEIINPNVEFHFILGFAKDTYGADGRGTGDFYVNWNGDFFGPQYVRALKSKTKHPDVKVAISIGGRDADCPFFPAARDEWWRRATISLNQILRSYNDLIDGIDINYVTVKSSGADFSYCIGELIAWLRHNGNVNVVSIAPSLSTQIPYQRLYLDRPDYIDYVDYQFYNQQIESRDDFITLFHRLSDNGGVYPHEKLLVGGSTDPNDENNFRRDVFIEGCRELVRTGLLRGIFIWNANDSANTVPAFYLDNMAQEIIIHH